MQSDVVQAASVARHQLGQFIERGMIGDETIDEVLKLADALETLMQALRVTAGTMRIRDAP